jgi:hypothetical protein
MEDNFEEERIPDKDPNCIRVATYNVHSWFDAEFRNNNRQKVVEAIRSMKIDVVR